VTAAARDIDEGVPFEDPAPRLVEENLWRAIRYGMDGDLIDLERGEVEPARAAVERLVAWSGADVSLPELNGAQRQRRLLEAGTPMEEVFAQTVSETRGAYAGEQVHRV
jgi:carboxylate-amine ligase